MNNFEPVIILEYGGRRRPGLYADIPVPVLQVPAGAKWGPGDLPNILKGEEKEEDDEGKQTDDEEEEEMEGKRRDEEEIQDNRLVEESTLVNLPLVPLPLVSSPSAPVSGFFLSIKS